jgi:hypothetical protein
MLVTCAHSSGCRSPWDAGPRPIHLGCQQPNAKRPLDYAETCQKAYVISLGLGRAVRQSSLDNRQDWGFYEIFWGRFAPHIGQEINKVEVQVHETEQMPAYLGQMNRSVLTIPERLQHSHKNKHLQQICPCTIS